MPYLRKYLLLSALLLPQLCNGQYLAAFSGYQTSEHAYLGDDSNLQGLVNGASLDLRAWRRRSNGWLSRGPKVAFKQGAGTFSSESHVSIYQWRKHQGIWLSTLSQQQTLQTELSQEHIFLDNAGTANILGVGTLIKNQRSVQRTQLYWHESSDNIGPLNLLGVFNLQESTPVSGRLSNTNASLFEGQFSGFGLILGRLKDKRGVNFQWQLSLAQLNSDFSNAATSHRTIAPKESSVYQLGVNLSWHYRHYLAPYWYLVPQFNVQHSSLIQTTSNPQTVQHDAFRYLQIQSFISLRRYF